MQFPTAGGLPNLPLLPNLGGAGLPGLPKLGGLPGVPLLGVAPGLLGGLPGVRPGFPLAPGGGVGGLLGLQAAGGLARPAAPGLVRPGGPTLPATGAVSASTSKASPVVVPPAILSKAGVAVPPVTAVPSAPCTVYVGRISTEVSDDFVRQLLEKCGKISKWNRAADPNTSKLTSFGFCDFEEPQGVYRALEFLHEKQLCDKRLLVKCEEKAKQTIDSWKDGRRKEIGEAKDKARKDGVDLTEGPLTDAEFEDELRKESKAIEDEVTKLLAEKSKGYAEVKMDNSTEEKPKDEIKIDDKAADKAAPSDNKENKDDNDAKDKKEESKDDDKDGRDRKPEKKASPPRPSKSEEARREREKAKRNAVSKNYRENRRERDRDRHLQARERDIDKEYQYRFREFEKNEDRRIRNLKRDLEQLDKETGPSERDKRRKIDQDLAWGKDHRDIEDWKRRREDRARERQRQKDADDADRAAEQKDVDEIKRKQEEEEARKRKEEEDRLRKEREEREAEIKRQKDEEERIRQEEERKKREAIEKAEEEERLKREAELKKVQEAAAAKLLQQIQEELRAAVHEDGTLKRKEGLMNTSGVGGLFHEDEELDEKGNPRKHKKLTRLEQPVVQEVKLKDDEMRRLIQQVPTDKAKAFAFQIDWQAVHDHGIVEKKLRPWVKKKVTEYLGAEESGMIDFIIRKVNAHSTPDAMLAELEGFLDDEAENFTLKMWRMLIFEVLRVKVR